METVTSVTVAMITVVVVTVYIEACPGPEIYIAVVSIQRLDQYTHTFTHDNSENN